MAIIAVEITCQCYIFSCVKLVSWPAFPLICLLDSDVRNVQVVGYVLSVSPRVHEGYIIVSVQTRNLWMGIMKFEIERPFRSVTLCNISSLSLQDKITSIYHKS